MLAEPPVAEAPPDAQMVEGVEVRVLEGRACTAEEEFYLRLDEDAIRQSVPRLNDALARVLALATALAGGTLGFLKDDVCAGWGRVLAALCFFAALLAAAAGTVPFRRAYESSPDEIRAAFQAAGTHKRRLLLAALGGIAAGLLAALAGTAARAFG